MRHPRQNPHHRDCGVWGALRPLKKNLAAQRNHPLYAARDSKEHPLLEQLINDDPPAGGLAAYIRAMGL